MWSRIPDLKARPGGLERHQRPVAKGLQTRCKARDFGGFLGGRVAQASWGRFWEAPKGRWEKGLWDLGRRENSPLLPSSELQAPGPKICRQRGL